MPKRKKLNFKDLYYDFDVEGDLVNFIAFNYKRITSMNSDELAYEYLKRNPLFLADVLNDLKELKKKKDNLFEFIYEMKYYYQRKYLYNPVDVYGRYCNYEDISVDKKIEELEEKNKNEFSYSFTEFLIEGETSKSQYVNLYNMDINNEQKARNDSYKNKQRNSIRLDDLCNLPIKNSRWLNWLKPSINIEINPNQNKDELKEQFQKLITLFENNEKLNHVNHVSAPNYILDNFDIDNLRNKSLLLDIKSPRNAAMQLFFYDVQYIFGLSESSNDKLTTIFEMAFQEDFDKFTTIENKENETDRNSYKTILSKEAERRLNYSKPYIFGDYLKLIYPSVSIEKHFYDMKDIVSLKYGVNYSNILDIKEKEYDDYNEKIYNLPFEDKLIIMEFLFRSPFDEIDKIRGSK